MIDKTPQGTTIDATVTADGIKFTVPADLTEDEYTVSLVRGKYTWALGTTAVYVDRRIESITISDHMMLSEPLTATFHYNNDGALEKITTNDQYVWEFAYSGNTVTVAPVMLPLEKLTYTLDENGRITSSTGFSMQTGEEIVYAWNYDAEGHLVSIVDKANAESQENLTAKYENGDLSEYNLIFTNNFTTDKSIRVCPNTTEPAYLVNIFALMMTREDLFLGFLLNRNVTTSTYVPNKLLAGDLNENSEIIQNEAPIETGFNNNTLTLKTTGMYISAGQSMLANTVTVKYQNK